MAEISRKVFLEKYTAALRQQSAAMFVGAGLSRGCGYADWRELLKTVAAELDLEIDKERDLLAVAQFHVNKSAGRGNLNQLIVTEFTRRVALSENHNLIAQLPVHTVWTTNYDTLLEQALHGMSRRYDVKYTQEQLAVTPPHLDVVLYKMHGDVSHAASAVVTKEDYETFGSSRQLFTEVLKGDLLSKTFLFLGFSFEDPNIDYILGRIRILLGANRREHYCVMRRIQKPQSGRPEAIAEFEYNSRRQALRVDDLGRYGIQTVLVDEFAEITDILRELARRCSLWNVFVSGSACECIPFGMDKLRLMSRELGRALIGNGSNIISGFGLGVGSDLIMGAAEECARGAVSLDGRLRVFPFPQGLEEAERRAMWPKYRRQMIDMAGCVVFLCGNKRDASGAVVSADGVKEEFAICKELGRYPIPVGISGYVAAEIHQEVMSDMKRVFGGRDLSAEMAKLMDGKATVGELAGAVIGLINKLRK